jgi:sugar/nucleoside kinase (ribokinase family)
VGAGVSAYDLLVVGRPSVDVMFSDLKQWPELGNDVDAGALGVCAGTSFNTPAAANRIGLRVAYVAEIGTDVWSGMVRAEFDTEGLPTEFLVQEDRPLPAVSVALNLHGDRGFVSHWGGEDVADVLVSRALDAIERFEIRHLHSQLDDLPQVESAADSRGMTVSLDAFDGASWASPRELDVLLRHADVLLANEAEACAMTGEDDVERALAALATHCPCVVIRRGAGGAIGIAGGAVATVPADEVDAVDTTGAGDCFNAGFLAGWLGGLPLGSSLTLGVICGSRSVTDFGGYRGCPHEAEFRELAAARGVAVPTPTYGEPVR